MPGPVSFYFNFGFPLGRMFACLAETMKLILDSRLEDKTLGKSVSRQRMEEITAMAAKHGFPLSCFRSFERETEEEQIETVLRHACLARGSN